MDRDTLMLIAFCAFLLLVGIRLKQQLTERKKQNRPLDVNASPAERVPERSVAKSRIYRRRIWEIVQLLVVGGLLLYMSVVLIGDFNRPVSMQWKEIFLRCLIFIVSIYILILTWIRVFKPKNKQNTEE